MTAPRLPDVEDGARTWAREKTAVTDLLGGPHVYFGAPTSNPSEFVTVSRVGGTDGSGLVPLSNARISFACWGSSKKKAADVARALAGELLAMEPGPLGNDAYAYGASDVITLWQPDRETDRPRYVVDCLILARHHEAPE